MAEARGRSRSPMRLLLKSKDTYITRLSDRMDDLLTDHYKHKKELIEEICYLKLAHLKEKRDLQDEILELHNRIRDKDVVIEELQVQTEKITSRSTNVISENSFLRQKVEEFERRPRPLPCGLPDITRAALDVVCKWDAVPRLDDQRKELAFTHRELRMEKEENVYLEAALKMANERLSAFGEWIGEAVEAEEEDIDDDDDEDDED